MRMSTPENYFRFGLAALAYIELALEVGECSTPKKILDLPSGYGRVLRMLKVAFPEAELTACDLDRAGVDFCAEKLGATPVYSREDPAEIELGGGFDVIWCGSLLTHLDAPLWDGFLKLFAEQLAPGGLLVATTHGRKIAEKARTGERRFAVRGQAALIRKYDWRGFGFSRYRHSNGYGISFSSPAWVCAKLAEVPALKLIMYTEQGWKGAQDAFACVRE